MNNKTAPMSLKLPTASRERLSNLATIKKRPAHALAREAIETYIEAEETRERHNREAVESWEHYQETGLHVTGDEVIAWIETWGTENEKNAPICHV
jgi:predicted transcriptional regulator